MLKQRLLMAASNNSAVSTFLYSWGSSISYATGQNTTSTITTPTAIGGPSPWLKVVSFGGNTVGYGGFAIKSDGTLWSWGDSSNYGTGRSTLTNVQIPAQIGTDTDWSNVVGFGGGGFALKTNGTLWSWGESNNYQTGQNTTTNVQLPTQVGTDTDWAKIAGFSQGGFAIKTNGTMWSWGWTISYATGQGSTSTFQVPTQMGSATDWAEVYGMAYGGLAIKTNRALYSWGSSSNYATGQATLTDVQTPTRIGVANDWVAIAGCAYTGFALKANGTIWSWGQAGTYQTGQSTTTNAQTPTQIGVDTDWASIFAGFTSATGYAVKSNGNAYSWGSSATYQGGNGGTTSIQLPTLITGVSNWGSFSASTSAFAITGIFPPITGSIYSWGINTSGQTGQSTTSGTTTVPTAIAGSSGTWTKLSAAPLPAPGFGGGNGGQVSALKSDGTLWSWGNNAGTGLIGQGSVNNTLFPTQVGSVNTWADIAQGGYGGLGVRTNGTLWAWGYDSNGALGLGGSGAFSLTPVQIGVATTWSKVFISNNTSFLIDTSGKLWTMGTPLSFENGLNAPGTPVLTPTQVGVATNWKQMVTVGDQANTGGLPFTIGLRTDGTIWSVGRNVQGQTGQSTTAGTTLTFTQIGLAATWASIGAFSNYANSNGVSQYGCGFGIKTDGTLWSWGSSVGNAQGATGTISTPTQVGTDTDWRMVTGGCTGGTAAVGTNHVGYGLALKTTGTIWSWGDNTDSQAGQGGATLTNVPTQIGVGTTWKYIAAGGAQAALISPFGFAIS